MHSILNYLFGLVSPLPSPGILTIWSDNGRFSQRHLSCQAITGYCLGTVLMIISLAGCAAPVKNGFDLEGALIPPHDIRSGGPPRDGIPAIDHPRFIKADRADFLDDDDRVLGIARGELVKAYPIDILNWHEIVNDEFGGEPIAVTYCPLTGSGIAYLAILDGKMVNLGTSGLLYNNNLVMYDRGTGSLWSQLMNRALSGSYKGSRLVTLPMATTTWADWRARHPDTRVLSTETGYRRDYGRNPYAGYGNSPRIYFPLSHRDDRYPPKAWVVGVVLKGQAKAYPYAELAKTTGRIRDSVGGLDITVRFDPDHLTATVYGPDGTEIPSVTAYWFGWAAFHPDTQVFRAGGGYP